jgi:hypothetical protein
MNKTELRQIIKEEVSNVLKEFVHGLGAFRRLIITSAKHEAIKADIEKFMKRPEIKRDYPVKFTIKTSVMPNSFVIDMEGEGATALGNKLKDQAKKLDKSATVKVKTEAPKKAVKEIQVVKSKHMPTSSGVDFTVSVLNNYVIRNNIPMSLENIINDDESRSYKDFIESMPTSMALIKQFKNAKEVASKGDLVVYRFQISDEVSHVLIKKTLPGYKCIIGHIDSTVADAKFTYSENKVFGIEGAVREVHLSELSKEYIGQGYGNFLYHALWDDSSAIMSDLMLFKGSFAMWSGKIASEAEFFGGLVNSKTNYGTSKFIVPLNVNSAPKSASEIHNYIAIKTGTPKTLRKIAYNLQTINTLTELVMLGVDSSLNQVYKFDDESGTGNMVSSTMIEVIEEADSISDFIKRLADSEIEEVGVDYPKKYGTLSNIDRKKIRSIVMMFRDATIIVKESGAGNVIYTLI